MKLRILLVLAFLPIAAQAGSVWQKQSDEPCAGQVIVGDSGEGNDSYIIPANTDNYEQEDYDYEDQEQDFEDQPDPDYMDQE